LKRKFYRNPYQKKKLGNKIANYKGIRRRAKEGRKKIREEHVNQLQKKNKKGKLKMSNRDECLHYFN